MQGRQQGWRSGEVRGGNATLPTRQGEAVPSDAASAPNGHLQIPHPAAVHPAHHDLRQLTRHNTCECQERRRRRLPACRAAMMEDVRHDVVRALLLCEVFFLTGVEEALRVGGYGCGREQDAEHGQHGPPRERSRTGSKIPKIAHKCNKVRFLVSNQQA